MQGKVFFLHFTSHAPLNMEIIQIVYFCFKSEIIFHSQLVVQGFPLH